MCLYRVDEIYDSPQPEVKVGYKLIEGAGAGGKFLPYCYPLLDERGKPKEYLPRKKWLEVFGFPQTIESTCCQIYPCGFHVFETLEGARRYEDVDDGESAYSVVEVKYKNVLCRGVERSFKYWEQGGGETPDTIPTVVAKNILYTGKVMVR